MSIVITITVTSWNDGMTVIGDPSCGGIPTLVKRANYKMNSKGIIFRVHENMHILGIPADTPMFSDGSTSQFANNFELWY